MFAKFNELSLDIKHILEKQLNKLINIRWFVTFFILKARAISFTYFFGIIY